MPCSNINNLIEVLETGFCDGTAKENLIYCDGEILVT